MRSFTQGKSILPSSPPIDCDVALGLKMPPHPGGGGGGSSYFRYDTSDNCVVLPRNFEFDDGYLRAFGGGEIAADKGVFTASQRQELEKQTLIHKYIVASVPVPPQLLFTPSLPPVVPQSNMVSGGLDLLRFSSSGSDPEPWRCRRTDGKKWRCSKDVAPDQKYCDRHAHKTRPRSRKPVELSSHSSSYRNTTNNTTTVSPSARQLIKTPSPRLEFRNDKYDLESSIGIGSVILGSQMMAPPPHSPPPPPPPPPVSSSNKLSASSLSLSMPGVNGIIDEDDDVANGYNSNKYYYNPWVHPGGPLGEALCLGNASVTRGGSSVASPYEYSSSDGFNFIG